MHRAFHISSFALLVLSLGLICQPASAQVLSLETFASGFNDPVDITNAGDGRLFIVEQDGVIRIVDEDGSVLPTPFLNIDPRVRSTGNEQGLLGLAFHPDYQNNGYFYVNYSINPSGDSRISRFKVTADPNIADPNSELIIYEFTQDFSNHNGGDLNFGPTDGYLYIGTGDGGSAGDPFNRAQNGLSPLGKMLRIDVDNPSNGNNYGIPASNPFVGNPAVLDEIWALGLRNPWRFSFDRQTHDMWIGDVGQNAWEEIDFQPASSAGGENYGWRCYEGNNSFNTGGCGPIGNYVFPVIAVNHSGNCSITGGYVYRGQKYPNLIGKYLYTDYCSGRFWTLEPDGQGGWTNALLADLAFGFTTFGEDQNGELYVANIGNGLVYRVTDSSLVVEVADSVTVTRGQLTSGDENDLRLSDNEDLGLRRSTSDIQSRTEFVVKGVSPIRAPSSLQVTLEGAVFARSTVVQSIELYDFVANDWVLVDSRNASRFSDITITASASGDLSRFVQVTTQAIEARIRYQSSAQRQNFSSNTDQFYWTIAQ